MLRNLFLKTLRDHRWAILGYGLGMALYGALMMAMFPYISGIPGFADLMENYPEPLRAFFGEEAFSNFVTLEGFLALEMFSFAPLILAFFTVNAAGQAVAGEEEGGTLDLLLSNPLPRWRLVLEKYGAMAVALAAMCGLTLLTLIIGVVILEEQVPYVRLIEVTLLLLAITLFFGSLTLLLTTFLRRRVAVGIGIGLVFATYLWNGLAPLVEALAPYKKVGPFSLYDAGRVLTEGLDWGGFALLIGYSALFVLASLPLFRRKDLAV